MAAGVGCCVAAPLAPTPPMGWNSWDSYGTTVVESEVRANADYMAARLKQHGWQYVVVDIQWSEKNPKAHGYRENADLAMDGYGRLIPAESRFPSAAGGRGFKPLADYVHGKGLKFGIHIMRGIPRQAVRAHSAIAGSAQNAADVADPQSICKWNTDMYGLDMSKPGAQEYYDSIVALYGSWGVDFIKADNMLDGPYTGEIEGLSRAIAKSGRPIVLSLSPGPARLDQAAVLTKNAQMWRVSGDFWDRWRDLKRMFSLLPQWAEYAKPGNWPDADMLPLGRIGIRAERGEDRQSLLTHDEQQTLMTLWTIARSPLMFGGDLPSNDAWTLALLTNDDAIAVDQTAVRSRQIAAQQNQAIWVAEMPAGYAVAMFNTGDTAEEDIRVNFRDIGIPPPGAVREVWTRKNVGNVGGGLVAHLRPHASAYYRLFEKKAAKKVGPEN